MNGDGTLSASDQNRLAERLGEVQSLMDMGSAGTEEAQRILAEVIEELEHY